MKSRNVIRVALSVAVVLWVCLIMTTAAGWLVYKDIFFNPKIYSLNVVAQYLTENFRLIIGVTVLITGVFCVFRFAKGIWGWAQNTGRVHLLLVGAVTLSFAVVYADYIWGGRFLLFKDMGMDTICQYYPTYAYLVSQLKAGTLSLWNFEWGLGCDLVNAGEWLTDPCAWAVVGSGVLFGEGIMKWMLPVMQLVKMLASSLLCFGYLGSIGFSAKARFTAAYLYAFSGWIMLWGQHYYFGMAYVYVIALLWIVEKLLTAYRAKTVSYKNYLALGIMMFLIFIFSPYFGYMILLFAVVYTIFRMLYKGYDAASEENRGGKQTQIRWGAFFRELFPMMITVVLGILCAMVLILPYADMVLNTSTRVQGSFWERMKEYIFTFYDGRHYLEILGRIISNNSLGILGIDQMYYELPQLSFSLMNLLVLPNVVWFAVVKPVDGITGHRRRMRLAGCILMLLALGYPLFASLFNFAGIPIARFTYVLMPVFAVAYAYFMEHCLGAYRVNTGITVLALLLVYGVLYYCFWHYKIQYRFMNGIILLFCIGMVMSMLLLKYRKKTWYLYTTIVLMLLSAVYEGYDTNHYRETLTRQSQVLGEDLHGKKTREALAWLQKEDTQFYRVEKTYYDMSYAGDSLLQNYSSMLMYNSTMSSYLTDFYKKIYPPDVYKPISAGSDSGTYRAVYTLTNTKYLITDYELDWENWEQIYCKDCRYIYKNTLAGSIGLVYQKVAGYSDYEAMTVEEQQKAILTTLFVPDEEAAKWDKFAGGKEQMVMGNGQSAFYKQKGSYVYGTVESKEGGVLFLSIPYSNYWNIYVDGVRQEKVNADYGFMAVALEPGEHKVEAHYENVLYRYGAIGSVVSVLLFAGWIYLTKRHFHF